MTVTPTYIQEREEARARLAAAKDGVYQTGITPETTAHMLEAIATDKAVRLKNLARATTILCVMPVWVRAEEARALFGLPPNKLTEWAQGGKITAKKCDPASRGSATIYEVKSILAAIEDLPDYAHWLERRPDLKGAKRAKWEKENAKAKRGAK